MVLPGCDRAGSPLWSLADVGFSYGSVPVLQAVNLQFEAGRSYGILGPNGSGKTTLLDLLCGLHVPQTGHVTFCGQSLQQWKRRLLARKIALVPQDFAVRFDFTVREVVAMGRHPHLQRFAFPDDKDEQLVEKVLRELGIDHLAERPVTRLSGGEKQRVAVARALAQDPQVLLLDEATAHLDIYHSLEILQLIRRQQEEKGLGVIAVLHDVNLAASFCDELIFLRKGKVVCAGGVDEVLQPEVINEVYDVAARIREDDFSGCRQVSFRLHA